MRYTDNPVADAEYHYEELEKVKHIVCDYCGKNILVSDYYYFKVKEDTICKECMNDCTVYI